MKRPLRWIEISFEVPIHETNTNEDIEQMARAILANDLPEAANLEIRVSTVGDAIEGEA